MRYLKAMIMPAFCFTALAAEYVEVGSYPAKVAPEQIVILSIGEPGLLTDWVDDKLRYKKGDVLAKMNEEQLKEDREDLDLQLLSERITKKDSIAALKKQKRQLQFYFSLSERERRYASDIQVDGELPTREAIEDINERIELAEKEMELKPKRRLEEFEKKVKLNTITMPFDGRFQYQIILPEDRNEPYETKAVAHFATAIDDSSYYIAVPMTQATLSQLPAEKFIARIDLPAGKQLNGVYAHRRLEKTNTGEGYVYYFRVTEADEERAYSMLGSTAQVKLFYQLSDNLKRINMEQHYGGKAAESSSSKEEFIRKSFPGYNLLLETDSELLLIPVGQEP